MISAFFSFSLTITKHRTFFQSRWWHIQIYLPYLCSLPPHYGYN